MKPVVQIVDLGAANFASIAGALRKAGAHVRSASSPRDVRAARALVVPGVARFGEIARALDARDLRRPLRSALERGVPYLGICAGFQLLFERSAEDPDVAGLGFLAGRVAKLDARRLPHMGWNRVRSAHLPQVDDRWFYFAHSYAPEAGSKTCLATATYGEPFVAAGGRGAVLGVQFHPERSGSAGHAFLRSWLQTVRNAR